MLFRVGLHFLCIGTLCKNTHLKKSSLQKTCPFRAKHLSASWARQSQHLRHLPCQERSRTFRMKRSRMGWEQPKHFGIVAVKEIKKQSCKDNNYIQNSVVRDRDRCFLKHAWKYFLTLSVQRSWPRLCIFGTRKFSGRVVLWFPRWLFEVYEVVWQMSQLGNYVEK